jgi:hypothetical protein
MMGLSSENSLYCPAMTRERELYLRAAFIVVRVIGGFLVMKKTLSKIEIRII